MQFDLLRAFPYPVFRPKIDDYLDGDIQATVTFEHEPAGSKLRADVTFALSVPELTDLVRAGLASYVVVFACRDTYFRKAVSSTTSDFSYEFDGGMLRGQVLIYPYVIANAHIKDFTCPWINKKFGDGPFEFAEGSVLALDEPRAIYVDRDVFKPISSAFVMVADEKLTGHEWRIDPTNEKVRIQVSSELKGRIDAARGSASNRAVLLNSIYFGAVVQCLCYLREENYDYNGRRWAGIVRQKCHDLNLVLGQDDEVVIAQRLMKHPFSLVETYCFKETSE